VKVTDRLEIQRALVIYAHPDDAESLCSGTVALWARSGVEVTYCMITNGASGSDDPHITRKALRDKRRAEQEEAARILGVARVVGLEYEDGYLEPTIDVRRAVTRQVRLHRPGVILTMDPTVRFGLKGAYVNHPDHIAAGEVALRTINPDASTRQMFPELWAEERLEPHKPKAVMLFDMRGNTAAVDLEQLVVDVTSTIDLKMAALQAHASQFGPDANTQIRQWMQEIGRPHGYAYAEAFRVLYLE
jgi:LmbE family N-acetylglucosaminyl deacetylase